MIWRDSVGVGSSRLGLKSECADIFEQSFLCLLRCVKTGNKKRATCLATLLQNKFNSDVARFTTTFKPGVNLIKLLQVSIVLRP